MDGVTDSFDDLIAVHGGRLELPPGGGLLERDLGRGRGRAMGRVLGRGVSGEGGDAVGRVGGGVGVEGRGVVEGIGGGRSVAVRLGDLHD